MDDVRGVDDSSVAGSVHFSSLLVLGLTNKTRHKTVSTALLHHITAARSISWIHTWLRMSVAFLALMKSGVSVAKASIPLPFISCSSAFLYSLCEHGTRLQTNATLIKLRTTKFLLIQTEEGCKPKHLQGQREWSRIAEMRENKNEG